MHNTRPDVVEYLMQHGVSNAGIGSDWGESEPTSTRYVISLWIFVVLPEMKTVEMYQVKKRAWRTTWRKWIADLAGKLKESEFNSFRKNVGSVKTRHGINERER